MQRRGVIGQDLLRSPATATTCRGTSRAGPDTARSAPPAPASDHRHPRPRRDHPGCVRVPENFGVDLGARCGTRRRSSTQSGRSRRSSPLRRAVKKLPARSTSMIAVDSRSPVVPPCHGGSSSPRLGLPNRSPGRPVAHPLKLEPRLREQELAGRGAREHDAVALVGRLDVALEVRGDLLAVLPRRAPRLRHRVRDAAELEHVHPGLEVQRSRSPRNAAASCLDQPHWSPRPSSSTKRPSPRAEDRRR